LAGGVRLSVSLAGTALNGEWRAIEAFVGSCAIREKNANLHTAGVAVAAYPGFAGMQQQTQEAQEAQEA
jgi:hypothetical protein